jgi:hypothetical protein
VATSTIREQSPGLWTPSPRSSSGTCSRGDAMKSCDAVKSCESRRNSTSELVLGGCNGLESARTSGSSSAMTAAARGPYLPRTPTSPQQQTQRFKVRAGQVQAKPRALSPVDRWPLHRTVCLWIRGGSPQRTAAHSRFFGHPCVRVAHHRPHRIRLRWRQLRSRGRTAHSNY